MREEEIKQLEIDKIHWRDLYWEECEKNKRLKEDYIKLSKIVEINGGYRAKYVNELRDKIIMLEQENEKLKRIIGNIVYLYKEEPTELGEYVKSGFKGGMSN